MTSLQCSKVFKTKKIIGLFILIAMPLIAMLIWTKWYHVTFDAWADDSQIAHANYSALAGLYGKSEICRDKDSILGQYALTCTDIYSFCNTNPPNIEVFGDINLDKTKDCQVYMEATRPFRSFFIPSVIASILSWGAGIFLLIKYWNSYNRDKNLPGSKS